MDNKTNELAQWDFDLLASELDGLDFGDLDLDWLDECETISPDDFGDSFSLADGDKPEIVQMTFTLHQKQKELIEYAISICSDDVAETFGNSNKNGNGLYEVVRQWAEQRR